MTQVFIGRQPILDAQLDTRGYELFFRSSAEHNAALFEHSDLASSQVMLNTFMEMGLEQIVGSMPAFINLSPSYLIDRYPVPMSSEQTIMELHCAPPFATALVESVKVYRQLGFRFALDNYHADPQADSLLGLCDYAKVSILDLDAAQFERAVRRARQAGLSVIAQRVETHEQYAYAQAQGCQGFQGYFFAQPRIVTGRALPANRQLLLTLMARLEQPEISPGQLEELLAQDATLSYRLLRYANCATFALRKEVDSIKKAIILIGARTIKNWTLLLLMSQGDRSKSPELLMIAMTRARMCELMSQQSPELEADSAFTLGLLSVLDALIDTPMVEILDQMPLTGELKMALLNREGHYGALLKRVIDYERLRWSSLPEMSGGRELYQLYIQSVHWAEANRTLLQQD